MWLHPPIHPCANILCTFDMDKHGPRQRANKKRQLKKSLDLLSGVSDWTLFWWSVNTSIENSMLVLKLTSLWWPNVKKTASVVERDCWRFTMKAWLHGILRWSQACCLRAVVSWVVSACASTMWTSRRRYVTMSQTASNYIIRSTDFS